MRKAQFGHLAILDLDQQAVTQNASVVDQAMNGAEILGDLADRVDDLFFISDIAQISASLDPKCLTDGDGLIEFLLIEVQQRQVGAFAGQVFGHGSAQPLAAAGDDYQLVFQFHMRAQSQLIVSMASLAGCECLCHSQSTL
ncbi:Unknown protein sequence [Pseudomonas syringae pv. aptata]|nr:Unknown protein sequence [Pseudomonas syringae pv. aptata]